MPEMKSRLPFEIWVLLGANTIIALGYGVVSPVLSAYARHFGVSISAAAFVVTIFAIMRLCFAPVGGMLVQHFGERKIYIIGLLIVAASTGACGFIQSYQQLLIFRGLAGVGSTMFFIAALGLIVRISPSGSRGRASGMLATAFLLGTVGGPILGSCTASLGLNAPFLIYGLMLLLAAFIVFVSLRKSRLAEPAVSDIPTLSVQEAFANRSYRAALMSNFATGWSVFGLRVALVPLFVTEIFHRTTSIAGITLAIIAIGNICVALPSGRLSDRVGRRKLLLAGLLCTGIATILLGQVPSLWMFFIVAYIIGLSSGLYTAPQQAAIADIVGNQARAGTAVAIYQMMSDLGSIAGSLGTGFLAQHLSFTTSFCVSGIILLIAALAWMIAPDSYHIDLDDTDVEVIELSS